MVKSGSGGESEEGKRIPTITTSDPKNEISRESEIANDDNDPVEVAPLQIQELCEIPQNLRRRESFTAEKHMHKQTSTCDLRRR